MSDTLNKQNPDIETLFLKFFIGLTLISWLFAIFVFLLLKDPVVLMVIVIQSFIIFMFCLVFFFLKVNRVMDEFNRKV